MAQVLSPLICFHYRNRTWNVSRKSLIVDTDSLLNSTDADFGLETNSFCNHVSYNSMCECSHLCSHPNRTSSLACLADNNFVVFEDYWNASRSRSLSAARGLLNAMLVIGMFQLETPEPQNN